MDIDMPIKDGYQTTKEIIKFCNEKNIEVPLICACSAFKGDADRRKAKSSGMNYFLEKPL